MHHLELLETVLSNKGHEGATDQQANLERLSG
jgi:hypothetical protein